MADMLFARYHKGERHAGPAIQGKLGHNGGVCRGLGPTPQLHFLWAGQGSERVRNGIQIGANVVGASVRVNASAGSVNSWFRQSRFPRT